MHWFGDKRLARRVKAEDAAFLLSAWSGWTGRLAVQVGVPEVTLGTAARYVQWIKAADRPAPGGILAVPHALPLPEAGADAVFLVHALEQVASPSAVIEECARILRGEGRLVVIGFRPISPAAIGRIAGARRHMHAHLIGPWRLRRLVVRAGLAWEDSVPLQCSPLWGRLPALGRRLTAGSYAAIAVKRTVGMTVLRPVWKHAAREGRAIMPGAGRAG